MAEDLPSWWTWQVVVSHHASRRMAQRMCPEWMLRSMLQSPSGVQSDAAPGRFLIEALNHGRLWHIIVEPDYGERVMIVVTLYPVDIS